MKAWLKDLVLYCRANPTNQSALTSTFPSEKLE